LPELDSAHYARPVYMAQRHPKDSRQKQAPAWAHVPPVSIRRTEAGPPPRGLDEGLTRAVREWYSGLGLDGLAAKVQVIWNARLRTTAGTACPQNASIELNPLIKDFGPAQVRRTLKHEAAHLVAHYRAGRRRIQTHGVEWQQACTDLGIPGEGAFHELPLARRRMPRKYAYRCRHCGLTVQRVRPFQPYTACYKCCQRLNAGKYHSNFLFIRVPFPPVVR
jgi:SprT protein